MEKRRYTEIRDFLRSAIEGTLWQGNVYVVGGCVRDELLGLEIKDIDICVSLPGGGVRFAEWLRDQNLTKGEVAVYPSYGTAMVHLVAFPDVELEFVQTRKEKYIDKSCRNPVTAFGSIEEDALRRDLTINSLSIDVSSGKVVDVTGRGIQDIKDHIIRTPVDPDMTYDDDPLRILRCIRFASRYGWDIDTETFEGMKRNVDRLSIICRERIQMELDKMLTCDHPVMAMELLRSTGAMKYVFPEFLETYGMTQNEYHSGTVWQHTMSVLGGLGSSDLKLRMAALLHDVGKVRSREESDGKIHFIGHESAGAQMAVAMLQRLRYSTSFIKEVAFLIEHHMFTKPWQDDLSGMKSKHLRKLQWLCGTEKRFDDLMILVDADNRAHAPAFCMEGQISAILQRTEEMKSEGSALFDYRLPFDGQDVMKIKGLKPGPEVKEVLEYLMKLAFQDPLRSEEQWMKHLIGYRLKR